MRTTFILALSVFIFSSCNKDKYTTAPQIKFKSISPNFAESSLTTVNKESAPKLTLEVTDAEGDIGFIQGFDTSMVYIKNLKSGNLDSFYLPDIQTSAVKNFKGDVIVNLFDALECIDPGPARPRTDTLFYEVYIKDFAKNKSNVIVTDQAVYYRCL
ncbi:MAG: hypothetical protein ABI741_05135 [Ferruginibacter sp.]